MVELVHRDVHPRFIVENTKGIRFFGGHSYGRFDTVEY